MKLSHAVFVYPRIELPYINEWLDFHEKQGIDHVYMSLHLNYPRDEPLNFDRIVWKKKPNIPYILDLTEDELLEKFLNAIESHHKRNRITLNLIPRHIDTTGKTHKVDQHAAYNWAQDQILSKNDNDWDWVLVGDIDEFFVPKSTTDTMKSILQNVESDIATLRCYCVAHPSRYIKQALDWNTYSKYNARNFYGSKYAALCSKNTQLNVHWSNPKNSYRTLLDPPFYIHHFCGFQPNKNFYKKSLRDQNFDIDWPKQYQIYINKKPEENFVVENTSIPNKVWRGP